MTTPRIKLVALDLDGTIVEDDLHIAQAVHDVIDHLQTKTDVKVVIATGRMFPSALQFARRLNVTNPLITYQGAMIRELDEARGYPVLYHQPLSKAVGQSVLELLESLNYHVNLYVNDQLFTSGNQAYADCYAELMGFAPLVTENLLDHLSGPPTKLMVIDDHSHRIDALFHKLAEMFSVQDISYCRSSERFCEIIHPEVSKWNAIMRLAEGWGLWPEEVLAIGDQGNDISMLQGAGIGVAMGNAPDEVKAHANHVTGTIHENGAVQAIEKFVL